MRRMMVVLGVTGALAVTPACGGGQPGSDNNNLNADGGVDGPEKDAGPPLPKDPPAPPEPVIGSQIDREGRDGTNLAVMDPWGLQNLYSFQNRDVYNRAHDRSLWADLFRPNFEFSLGVWDGLDGTCGNQWLAGPNTEPGRYSTLATLLLDDVLLLDTTYTTCNEWLAVELRIMNMASPADCGGRTPRMNAKDALMTMLSHGPSGRNSDGTWQMSDGITFDQDGSASLTEFPFLLPSNIGTPGSSTGGVDPQQIYLTCATLAETRCNRVYKCWGRNDIPAAYRDAYNWEVEPCVRGFDAECKGTSSANFGPHCPSGQVLDPIKLRACERAYSMASCTDVEAAGAGILSACGNMCM